MKGINNLFIKSLQNVDFIPEASITEKSRFRTEIKPVISCHKHNLKPSLVQYIYRICYKNAKKANSRKMICPI